MVPEETSIGSTTDIFAGRNSGKWKWHLIRHKARSAADLCIGRPARRPVSISPGMKGLSLSRGSGSREASLERGDLQLNRRREHGLLLSHPWHRPHAIGESTLVPRAAWCLCCHAYQSCVQGCCAIPEHTMACLLVKSQGREEARKWCPKPGGLHGADGVAQRADV